MSVREGYKQTEIGVIPEEWEVVNLGSQIDIVSGQSPSKFDLTGNTFPFFKVNQLNYCDKYLLDSEYKYDTNTLILKKGCVVFPKRGASIFTNKIRILGTDGSIDTNLMALLPKDSLSNEYLYYWLMLFELSSIADTSSVPQINNKHINPISLPLPPLPEQQKIAAILISVDNKIEVIDEQIAKTETLKKGLMQKLLSEGVGHSEFKESEIGRIPKEWEVVRLPDITEKITSGGTPSRKKPEYFENGTIGWLKTGELRDCYIYRAEEKITEDALKNSSAKLFPIDTVLIAMYGATIGQTAYLKQECATNQACCALIFDQSVANPLFYWKYFYFIKENLVSKGIGAGQPNISQGIIKDLPVIYPPVAEQKRIATILSTVDDKLDTLREKKFRYEKLKKGLMQKLLTGEVRVKV